MPNEWDVIVAGAGPGGNMAARKCAGSGFKTLLLEKSKLPRDKVCSGMIMGEWAQKILAEEFGQIPDEVLVEPKSLLGYAVHVPGTPFQTLDMHTPITWRKNLDYWMSRKARNAGAQVWDEARVVDVKEENGQFTVMVKREGEVMSLQSRFLIGADGARSVVRGALFPDLQPAYWHCYRECYDVRLDLPERRFNFFSTIETAPFYFCTHDKDGYMLMEGGAPVGQIKQTAAQSREFLIQNHSLDPRKEPLWKDGCVEPILYRELFTKEFRPAKGNALLAGDAAGMNMPVTGEGVGTALLTGLEAAKAVIEARERNGTADEAYLKVIDEIIGKFQSIYQFSKRVKSAAVSGDPKVLADALLESWNYAFKVFE